jgi:formylglycine-generating enzyme
MEKDRLLLLIFIVIAARVLCFAEDTTKTAPDGMVLIPGGWFMMGSAAGEKDERPVHKVHVDSFYMGKSEVTVWQYLECVHAGACKMPLWWNKRFFDKSADELPGREWLDMPVMGVSWNNAQEYCRWKGNGARLPTEAEWEYAAHAGTTTEYFWGATMDSASKYAVVNKGYSRVMSRSPNNWGLCDMLGNAWEWCADRYQKDYYSASPVHNPQGPADSTKYPYRVVRGGSWKEYSWNLRCANRNFGEQARRFEGVGFRICKNPEAR